MVSDHTDNIYIYNNIYVYDIYYLMCFNWNVHISEYSVKNKQRKIFQDSRGRTLILHVNRKSDFKGLSIEKGIGRYSPSTTSFTGLPKRIFPWSSSNVQLHTPSSSNLTLSMCNAAVVESPMYRCPVPLISVLVSIVIMSTGLPSCSHVAGRIL